MSFALVGLGISVGGAALGAISANKAKRQAERKASKAEVEMDRLKDAYSALDTSNPYTDMENTMEDLTINQRQYDLEKQQFGQSQANVLGGLREAAGSSGIAAVAQALSTQGQLAAQSSAAKIGQQERQNQMAERNMAANLQDKEREGEIWSRDAERDKQSTLLGMSQQEVAAYREQAAAANQAKWDAIAGGVTAVGSILKGRVGASSGERFSASEGEFGKERDNGMSAHEQLMKESEDRENYVRDYPEVCPGLGSDRKLKKNINKIGESPSGLYIYTFEYKDKKFGKGLFQGVMSDEIPQDAVIKHSDGYDLVDYSKIDVEFKKVI